ncbi:hypothetical protein ACFCT7_00640 [Fulvivirgaceae bacterium LMO-SS25]
MTLPQDFDSAKVNLLEIHQNLSGFLTYSYFSYRMTDSDLFQSLYFRELVNQKWGQLILSKNTFDKGVGFYLKWVDFRLNKPYGDDNVFVYLDKDWLSLLDKYLIPFLKSMEIDFLNHSIEFISYENDYDKTAKPSNEEILKNAAHLYSLLLSHNIIQKENLE